MERMKALHPYIKQVWKVWFSVYLAFLLYGVLKNIIPCTFAGFAATSVYFLDIIYTIHKAALWLIPTLFLFAAVYLTKPKQEYTFKGIR